MKKFTHKNLLSLLTSKLVLAVSGSMILTSCVIYTGGYTETDGVYYDPNRDTLPEGVAMNGGNRVGDYYDYQYDDQNKYLNSDNRNQKWIESPNSDWGNYNGTVTYYSDWGYSPYSYGMGMGFGWGFGGYYNSWGFGYNPWYGYYNPWYGYYGYYNPWYGMYNPYYGGHYGNPHYHSLSYGYNHYNSYNGGFTYRRSGADGAFRNSLRNEGRSGFRNSNNSGFRNDRPNGGFRNNTPSNTPRLNPNMQNQPRIRNTQPNNQNNSPRYEQPVRTNNSGGFRSGNDGGVRSSGGFNSGSSNSGGSRSGGNGFRR